MKAIEVKKELVNEFLQACKIAGVSVQLLPKVKHHRYVYYHPVNVSNFNDIFKIGIYFAQLTYSK